MNIKNTFKLIITIILSYICLFLINNIRNFYNLITNDYKGIIYISIPIIISIFIIMIYMFFVRKKNIFNILIVLGMVLFYNLVSGNLYSSNLNAFFILFIIILIYSFAIYIKIDNSPLSIVIAFTILILGVSLLGVLGLLKLVKYLVPLTAIIILLVLILKRKKYKISSKLESFFDRRLLIFTILFVIAILGGIGRNIHTYDEYSHWAYDAKTVIYHDELSTAPSIMSRTRQYAPILTGWHYTVAQYSGFSEQNLYIGLSILIMIYLFSVLAITKKSRFDYLAMLSIYCAILLFGGVYNFGTLYADLAFGAIFGASFILYFQAREKKELLKYLSLILIVLTLVKPSGCTASFAILVYIFLDQLINYSDGRIFTRILNFIKKYWLAIACVILCFIAWRTYVKIVSPETLAFYSSEIRPDSLKNVMSDKMTMSFILGFISKLFGYMDDTLLYGNITVTLYQFIVFSILFIVFALTKTNQKDKILSKTIIMLITYITFYVLTALSIFISFSYYEASIVASFIRYLNVINIALFMIYVYYILDILSIKENKNITSICVLLLIIPIVLCPFAKSTYFITDYKERFSTESLSQARQDKFKVVNKNTKKSANIYVIDQKDKDGIMAMWYARYYTLPRQVNASSKAITWKIKTESNKDDLKNWGLTKDTIDDEILKYDFDYLFLYSSTKEFYEATKEYYDDYEEAKTCKLFKVNNINNQMQLHCIK